MDGRVILNKETHLMLINYMKGPVVVQWYSVGLKTGCSGFDSRQWLGIFLFTTASRTALWPTELPIQWVPGALSLGIKRPKHEADHSSPSSAEVRNAGSYTSTPAIYLHGLVLSENTRKVLSFTFFFSAGRIKFLCGC
jgi:hypothetical protein